MPPHEITGIGSSVRPKRRYFMRFGRGARPVSIDELQVLTVRDQPALEGLAQETPDRLAPVLAIIERPVIHVHSDELVRQVPTHVAGKLQRVLHGFGSVIKAVSDAGGENIRNGLANRRFKSFVDHVPVHAYPTALILP